ncbi:MAG: UrcA family protein [Rhizorhabdus sp.]|nr:UrcA family protein [Rhizorhabdus sp.]
MTTQRSLLAIVLAAGLSTAAFAGSADQISVSAKADDANTQVAAVSITDLDLSRRADQVELRARLASAVQGVCTFGGTRMPVDKGCTGNARADASRQAEAIIAMAARQASASRSSAAVRGAN